MIPSYGFSTQLYVIMHSKYRAKAVEGSHITCVMDPERSHNALYRQGSGGRLISLRSMRVPVMCKNSLGRQGPRKEFHIT